MDRSTYLKLLKDQAAQSHVRVLGWCLMSNHTHLIAIPGEPDALAILLRRLHGRYAQYYNTRVGRAGHLWQNRYYACALGPSHLASALAYVDRNPVRAAMVARAEEYQWSSALAHCIGHDDHELIDIDWWEEQGYRTGWGEVLNREEIDVRQLEKCTFAGKPFGEAGFVQQLSEQVGRHWVRGRPRKAAAGSGLEAGA